MTATSQATLRDLWHGGQDSLGENTLIIPFLDMKWYVQKLALRVGHDGAL